MNKKREIGFVLLMSLVLVLLIGIQSVSAAEVVSTSDVTVCCEKTNSGLYCQNVPQSECSAGSKSVPTSCESTSFCRAGTCVDGKTGTCTENTGELVCNNEGGVWFNEKPAQCSLGCCVLGDQAAFVTQTRCKALSADLGLKTNYNSGIKDETSCVLSVAGQEKGACVYDFEFERTCRLTTRAECGNSAEGSPSGEFFQNKLCSAEELGTNCGKTTQTTTIAGKDGVYWQDSCGNAANIYDSSKVSDAEYWSNIKSRSESCNPNSDNANSESCGNCNYLLGSFGRAVKNTGGSVRYGGYICASLNCEKTSNGKSYRHGESWCVNDDKGGIERADNSVGSKFFRHLCINGAEVVESCADFRQETCIEDKIETSLGTFSQSACRVNRWQDCFAQNNQVDCGNTDRRDCLWKPGDFRIATLNNKAGICVPKNTPGLKFWEGEEASGICAQANAQCVVTFKKGLFGKEQCEENCECISTGWEKKQADVCTALGDCGPGINWEGQKGFKKGYSVVSGKVKSPASS